MVEQPFANNLNPFTNKLRDKPQCFSSKITGCFLSSHIVTFSSDCSE